MPVKWTWGEIAAGEEGPGSLKIYSEQTPFETKEAARADLQRFLDGYPEHSTKALAAALLPMAGWRGQELLVACPPKLAWAVFPVPQGQSVDQAGVFFLQDHMNELDDRLLNTRTNSTTGPGAVAGAGSGSGCAVLALVALGAFGAVAASLAQAIWA